MPNESTGLQAGDAEFGDRLPAMRFLFHALLVCLPLFPLAVVTVVFARTSGETMPPEEVLAQQSASTDGVSPLFLKKYTWQGKSDSELKSHALEVIRPTILIAGSSRSLGFRAELLFSPGEVVYNGGFGFGMRSVPELQRYADRISSMKQLKGVLLTVDRWWFRADEESKLSPIEQEPRHSLTDAFRVHAEFVRDGLRGSFTIGEYLEPRNRALGCEAIGLSAIEIGGYRPDGSYCYANNLVLRRNGEPYMDRNWRPHVVAARQHASHFQAPYGTTAELREAFMNAIKTILNSGIQLAVINPPFSTDLWRVLTTDPRHMEMTQAETKLLSEVLEELGVCYVDARDLSRFGLTNDWMVDGYHSSESANAVILRELWQRPDCPEVLKGCGLDVLEKVISTSTPWELNPEAMRGIWRDYMSAVKTAK